MNDYKLVFKKKMTDFEGYLILFLNGEKAFTWKARSGQKGFQFPPHFRTGSSPIPESKEIIGSYEVDLNGYASGDQSSMGDLYFHILPDPIISRKGIGARTEIGIHEDGNQEYYPGSAGCIAIDKNNWQDCKKTLLKVKKLGFKRLPLEVIYY